MTKVRIYLIAAAVTLFTIFPLSSAAMASHTCGLEDVSYEVNTICDGYHSPKPLVQWLICHFITHTC